MKTRKSHTKRIKKTKHKSLVRQPGQNHFRAKKSSKWKMNKKKKREF